jgi:signal peptidase II
VKYKHLLLIILLILVVDQVSKIYVKTHFLIGGSDAVNVLGTWFQLYFIENEGMAFGMKILDAPLGKLILTLFRLVAVIIGFFWVKKLTLKGHSKGLLICAALILAGAAGNLIDSMLYGLIFTESDYTQLARLVPIGQGYGSFMHGKVVDMLYFPMIDTTWPQWVPYFGGKHLSFFDPIFNIADVAISTGVITMLVFQKRFLKASNITTNTTNQSFNSNNHTDIEQQQNA